MNYILFNNDILVSDGKNVHRVKKDDGIKEILNSIETARICVLDVDVMMAASVESPIEKKDNILVRKFKEFYQQEPYIIQDERIDNNLFQVIGVKEQRVREIYSFISPSKVEVFVPYAIALRNALIQRQIDLNKTVLFIDDRGEEKFLTVFDGLLFSRTRAIAHHDEDLLPEIKRSQIDFLKKNEEYLNRKNTDFLILTNNQSLAFEISKNQEGLPVQFLDLAYPALEGLKEIETNIKFVLPEEILRQRQELLFKKNLNSAVLSLFILAAGSCYFLFNKIESSYMLSQCEQLHEDNRQLEQHLSRLDRQTYREDLKQQKRLNYAVAYLSVLNLIPPDYEVVSFKFIKSKHEHWQLDLVLSSDSAGEYAPIPPINILKNAEVKDVFINNQPGKHLRLML